MAAALQTGGQGGGLCLVLTQASAAQSPWLPRISPAQLLQALQCKVGVNQDSSEASLWVGPTAAAFVPVHCTS